MCIFKRLEQTRDPDTNNQGGGRDVIMAYGSVEALDGADSTDDPIPLRPLPVDSQPMFALHGDF